MLLVFDIGLVLRNPERETCTRPELLTRHIHFQLGPARLSNLTFGTGPAQPIFLLKLVMEAAFYVAINQWL